MEPSSLAIKGIIFDLDGTLAKFNLDYKTLRSEVRSYLMRNHVPSSVLNVNESIFEMLKKTEIFMKNNSKSTDTFESVRHQALAIAEKYEMTAALTTSLLTGAVETLKSLQKMNLKMGICTASSRKAANYILRRFKIDGFFQVVISRDRVKYVKPSTEQVELALEKLGVSPKTAVIVGDSIMDMKSAVDLNAIAVGLPMGMSTKEQLISSGANYLITSLADLPILIREINKD